MFSANENPLQRRIVREVRIRTNSLYALYWIIGTAAVAIWSATTANPVITIFAATALPVLVLLLWRRGEPPILLFVCAMQWLQAVTLLFYANYFDVRLAYISVGPLFLQAITLSTIAVLCLAAGIRVALWRAPKSFSSELRREAMSLLPSKIFAWYIYSIIAGVAAVFLGSLLPPLRQPLIAVEGIKWTFVFILAYTSFEKREGYQFLVACLAIEIVVGLLGFFAGFKTVFLVVLVAVLGSSFKLRGQRLVATVVLVTCLIVLASAWQATKGEYREFLNQGAQTQEVVVPVGERLRRLGEIAAKVDIQQLLQGFDQLVLRMSYVEFFALTIGNVPENIPYEHGALWLDTVKRVFTPRILFPSKAIVDDSERTTYYTGVEVSGAERGTSISIGYFGESYIDFGPLFMVVPIFLLGVVYGFLYRCFILNTQYKLFGTGVLSAIMLINAYNIETSNIKVVGAIVAWSIVLALFYRIFTRRGYGYLKGW